MHFLFQCARRGADLEFLQEHILATPDMKFHRSQGICKPRLVWNCPHTD